MPKSTKAQTLHTKQSIIDAAFDIVVKEGFDHASIAAISNRLGLTRGAVTCHFKRKEEILKAIEPMLAKLIREPLDFSSAEAFKSSWIEAVGNSPTFVAAIKATGPVIPVRTGVDGMVRLINDDDEKSKDVVLWCIGYASYSLDQQNKPA